MGVNSYDSEISEKSGIDINRTRAIIYKLIDEAIVSFEISVNPKTGYDEYRYFLNDYGIRKKLICEKPPVEDYTYPFPDEFIIART